MRNASNIDIEIKYDRIINSLSNTKFLRTNMTHYIGNTSLLLNKQTKCSVLCCKSIQTSYALKNFSQNILYLFSDPYDSLNTLLG